MLDNKERSKEEDYKCCVCRINQKKKKLCMFSFLVFSYFFDLEKFITWEMILCVWIFSNVTLLLIRIVYVDICNRRISISIWFKIWSWNSLLCWCFFFVYIPIFFSFFTNPQFSIKRLWWNNRNTLVCVFFPLVISAHFTNCQCCPLTRT